MGLKTYLRRKGVLKPKKRKGDETNELSPDIGINPEELEPEEGLSAKAWQLNDSINLENISPGNLLQTLAHIEALVESARLVVAGAFLQKVEAIVMNPQHTNHPAVKEARTRLLADAEDMDLLRNRCEACANTLSDWEAPDWIFCQEMLGVQTYYKKDPNNGSIWVKLNGRMEGVSVFNQLSCVREVDLFKTWMPFCNKSQTLLEIGKVEMLAYIEAGLPGMIRDCVIHAYACDCTLEDRCILIQGKSIDEYPGVEFPPQPKGFAALGRDKMIMRGFKSRIELLSPSTATTSIIANIDLNSPLPQSLIDFLMKKAAGMLLYKLVGAAKRIDGDPSNPHFMRIVSDAAFYTNFMLPKMQTLYKILDWKLDFPEALTASLHASAHVNGAHLALSDNGYDDDSLEISQKSGDVEMLRAESQHPLHTHHDHDLHIHTGGHGMRRRGARKRLKEMLTRQKTPANNVNLTSTSGMHASTSGSMLIQGPSSSRGGLKQERSLHVQEPSGTADNLHENLHARGRHPEVVSPPRVAGLHRHGPVGGARARREHISKWPYICMCIFICILILWAASAALNWYTGGMYSLTDFSS